MENLKTSIVAFMTGINLVIIDYFGVFTPLLYLTIFLMVFDLVTRVYAAASRADENVKSKKVMKGIYKKLGMCFLILLSLLLDFGLIQLSITLGISISANIIFTALTISWIFVRELISNLENLAHAGIDLPIFITKALSIAKDKVESLGDTMTGGNNNE